MKKKAFTLAEVLITLGIIGVVAAMTLPTLVQKHQEKVTVTRLKKFYSEFQQALLMARNEKGDFINKTTNNEFYDYIKPYLKIQKDCGSQQGCFADTMIKTLDGTDWLNIDRSGYKKIILYSGASLQLYSASTWGEGRAEMRVDINGFKKPNMLGKDIFNFNVENNKIIPLGLPENHSRAFETHCNLG